jgi:hypothetical protein
MSSFNHWNISYSYVKSSGNAANVLVLISVADPWHFGVDPYLDLDPDADADPAIFIIDLQDNFY